MKKNVLWIDQNNGKEENKRYIQIYSKELKDFSFYLVTSVEEGYLFLGTLEFGLVYVILSGRLAEEFLDIYEENLRKSSVLTLNIIFCFDWKYHQSKKYANDPFYNPGGVVTEFEEVIKFLKKDNSYHINERKINKEFINNNDKLFIIIPKSIENISFPVILKKFSSRFINEGELEKFKRFLINNYYDPVKSIGLLDIFNSKIKIPYYLLSKIFIRLYSMSSSFCSDLNRALRNNNFSDFNQYIFTLYYGLNQKIIKDFHDDYLYRLSYISKNEFDNIINSSCGLVLTQTFLSFSKSEKVAMFFMKNKKILTNMKRILFIINPLKQKDITVTNIDVEEISFFQGEKEVLFLPFSGFEITKIEEQTEYTTIYLNYLNKFEKKIWIIFMQEVKIE